MVDYWVQGEVTRWGELRGKVVLLQVGETDIPSTKELLKKFGEKGLAVVTVVRRQVLKQDGQTLEARCKENGVTWAFGVDASENDLPASVTEQREDGATASIYDSREFPYSTYLIDKKGIVRGAPTWRELEAKIKELLAEK
jgi:hypothetical protein